MQKYFLVFLISCLPIILTAQIYPFKDIILSADTSVVRYMELPDAIKEANRLPFYYRSEQMIIHLRLEVTQGISLSSMDVQTTAGIALLKKEVVGPANDFLLSFSFEKITSAGFYLVYLKTSTLEGDTFYSELELFPLSEMRLSLLMPSEEVFIGEEMVYELNVNLPDNLVIRSDWIIHDNYHYRITRRNERTYLHLVSLATGRQSFMIETGLFKPEMDQEGKLSYRYTMESPVFNVKSGRLAFLGIDLRELILDDESKLQGVEVQIDNHRLLQLNKTYRLEAQEEQGGALIAEIYMKSRLANNKVLAILRSYNYHRSSEGYLYLKEGDQAQFITNLSILPKTVIKRVKVLREGREWSDQIRVNPNETAIIRVEGQSINRGQIAFDIPGSPALDTLVMSDLEAEFKIHIPLNVPKSRLDILINGKPSGHAIQVMEYQRPRSFDHVNLDYGQGEIPLTDITGPIFYPETFRDIRISFNPEMIDDNNRLFGKQYLTLEVKVHGPAGQLLESFKLENIAVCPYENSPRYIYYSKHDCRYQDIMLNQFLSRKSYDWDIWTRVVISMAHSSDKYLAETQQRTVELILQRPFRFDVDVSFPAGLLIVRPGQEKLGNLSGISMAMVAQFSFYHKNQIAKPKPFKVGAGFLALNAFNFSEDNTNRDMGVVVLASVYPTRRDVKMSFPLYLGSGYFLNQKEWFFLLGPGIRVSF